MNWSLGFHYWRLTKTCALFTWSGATTWGNGLFFGMTYFSFVFYPERHDWVAAMLSKSPQNAGMHWLFHTY
jgi:hypothetical protein